MRGVTLDRKSGKWRADLHANGERVYLGLFDTATAAEARLLRARSIAAPYVTGRRSDNTSGCPGVSLDSSGKWRARFKSRHLGLFEDKNEAIRARKNAEFKAI